MPLLIKQTEALTWRPTDDDIGFGYHRCRVFQNVDYITIGTVVAEVGPICSGGINIEVVPPHHRKTRAEAVTKTERETARSRE